jgi:hypothetical protein
MLSSQTLSHRVLNETKRHHRWLAVVYHYSDSFPRALRVVSLATNIIIMLFIQSLTYTLTNPDDGSCEALNTRLSCIEPQSSFATGESKCEWDGTQCTFIQPSGRIKIVLFVAIFSAIISTPIALSVDWIVRHILAANTAKSSTVAVATSRYRARTESDPFQQAESYNRSRGRTESDITHSERKKHLSLVATSAVFMAQAELHQLAADVQQYREGLTAAQRTEFDGSRVYFC